MKKFIHKNKGSVTLLIIFLSAIILTVGLSFNWLIKEYIKNSQAFKEKNEAILKAYSTFNKLIYLILNSKFNNKEIILPKEENLTELKYLPLNGTKIKFEENVYIELMDSNGLISLTTIHLPALERLIKNLTGKEDVSSIINAILDWLDPDELVRLNGAEAFTYKEEGYPYTPRNYAFQYKEEILLIRGIGKELYKKISPYITILPNTGFNPNTAPDEVLKAYLNLNEETLRNIKKYLSNNNTISSITTLFGLTGSYIYSKEGNILFSPSYLIDLKLYITSFNNTIYTIKTGIDLKPNLYFPYSIIYWKEE